MIATSNNQFAAPPRTQLMATAATVLAFNLRHDGETADVVVEVAYPEHGHADFLRGTAARDGQARSWTHVHRTGPEERGSLHAAGQDGKPRIYSQIHREEFWVPLSGDELLGPNTAGCRRPMQPFVGSHEAEVERAAQGYQSKTYAEMGPFERMWHLTDRIIAAADQAVYAAWSAHPSSCRIRELEVHVRGEDVVRRQPILRPRIELFEDAIERADITDAEAAGAYFMVTLSNALKPTESTVHVTVRRGGPGNWVIQDVVGSDPEADEDEYYFGDTLFMPGRDDLTIEVAENGDVNITFD